MKINTTAGASVQPTSSSVLPCTCLGSGEPRRSRKRTITKKSADSTTTKTPRAHQTIVR